MNNKGIYLALTTAFISGVSVFLNKFAVAFWTSSSIFTTAKNLVVVILLISLIIFGKKNSELKKLSGQDWLYLVAIGFVGGSLPFLLFFKGLVTTSATTAAFIHKTLFVWVAVLAVPLLKERLSKLQLAALGILVIGTYLLASPIKLEFGLGEFLILLATFLWAIENIVVKVALRKISPLLTAAGRMFFGSIFLMIYLAVAGEFGQLFVYSLPKTGWLFLSGILLFGYVLTWYSSLKYLPATVASSILVVAAPLTAFLDSLFTIQRLKPSALLSGLIIAAGTILIIKAYERTRSLLQIRLSS
jgi:drug/metabolite transporter (DMT)-like permease